MAKGKLGSGSLSATTNTSIYTVPAGMVATVNINMANRTAAGIKVRLAIGVNTSPVDADYINYDVEIPAFGILERLAVAMSAGEHVVAYAAATGISVRVHGFEDAA